MIDISGFEGLYQISNTGNVFGIKRKKLLTPHTDTSGYVDYALTKNGITKRFLIHRLVAKTFIDNPNNLPEVNHKDGDKSNNNDWNLEWCTKSHNMQHAYDTKLQIRAKGGSAANHKLTDQQAQEVRSLKGTMTQRKIAELYGVSESIISLIILNKHYM